MDEKAKTSYETIYWGTIEPHGRTISELVEKPEIFRHDPFRNGWCELPMEIVERLIEKEGHLNGQYKIDRVTTAISQVDLPFYRNARLIRLADGTWGRPNLSVYFLAWGKTFLRLNGMSTPIHDTNFKLGINLNEGNVLDYLRFFCHFVHGDKGPFMLAETLNQAYLPTNCDAELQALVADSVHPACFNGMTDDGKYDCTGIIYYGASLFQAQFHVYPNGLIEMVDDEPFAQDLKAAVQMELV